MAFLILSKLKVMWKYLWKGSNNISFKEIIYEEKDIPIKGNMTIGLGCRHHTNDANRQMVLGWLEHTFELQDLMVRFFQTLLTQMISPV